MKATWIQYGKLLTEQHSIMALSAVLKQRGHESTLAYESSPGRILERLRQEKPHVVCYSMMFGSHWKYRDLCRDIRREFPGIYQVMGGPLTTFFPEVMTEFGLDAVCLGEGEIALPALLDNLSRGFPEKTPGFAYREPDGSIRRNDLQPLVQDFSVFDFPDRDLFYSQDALMREQEFKSFLSGRGCPYQCNYCFNHKYNQMYRGLGSIVRKKPVDYFMEEVLKVKKDYGFQYAIFEDDIFVLEKEWFHDFAEKFKRRAGVPYICYVRPNLVTDEVAAKLKDSGCAMVRMAIESGSPRVRYEVLNRKISDDTLVRAAEILHAQGLKISTSNMLGLPTETMQDVESTLELNIRCKVDNPTAQFFMPYPRMELSRIAVETGHFSPDKMCDIHKNTWKFSPLDFAPELKRFMGKTQQTFALMVKYPGLRRWRSLIFLLPDKLLYPLSLVAKILMTQKCLPASKVKWSYRLRFLMRFLSFYN